MIGCLSGLTVWIKEDALECETTHCVTHKKMPVSQKISPEPNSVFNV